LENCFDLLFAFDEVITAGGYREPITMQQIKTNMDMESHEEKLHNMIKISKMEVLRVACILISVIFP
jgi:coatomer subunit delta